MNKLIVNVPKQYHRRLIGANGGNKRSLEQQTECSLKFMKQDGRDVVEILAPSDENAILARETLKEIMDNIRVKFPPTHFISLPLNVDHLQDRFIQFKEDVLRQCGDSEGIEEVLFQRPSRLHLTIGVLTLMSKEEESSAISVIEDGVKDLSLSLCPEGYFELHFKGLHTMKGNPSKAAVLYAGVRLATQNCLTATTNPNTPISSNESNKNFITNNIKESKNLFEKSNFSEKQNFVSIKECDARSTEDEKIKTVQPTMRANQSKDDEGGFSAVSDILSAANDSTHHERTNKHDKEERPEACDDLNASVNKNEDNSNYDVQSVGKVSDMKTSSKQCEDESERLKEAQSLQEFADGLMSRLQEAGITKKSSKKKNKKHEVKCEKVLLHLTLMNSTFTRRKKKKHVSRGDTNLTDTGATATDGGSNPVDVSSTAADTGSNAADTGSNAADTGSNPANTGSNPADVGSNPADVCSNPANVCSDSVDVGANPADNGSNPADVGSDSADVGSNPADVGTHLNDTGTNVTDANPPDSDHSITSSHSELNTISRDDVLSIKKQKNEANESVSSVASRGDSTIDTEGEENEAERHSKRLKGRNRRHTFDATKILKLLSGFDFGCVRVSEIHLSSMTKIDEASQYYSPIAVIPLKKQTQYQ